jgi:hypothetical protein
MTKTRWCNTTRDLRALGVASFLVVVSNNFGDLLKGMGQELKKITGSDHTSESTAAELDKNKEADHANDSSGNDVKSK